MLYGDFFVKFDLHIHSKYSYDSFSDPKYIVKIAEKRGLDAISITDHNNMKVYEKFSCKSKITIIPGMEVKTDKGDVIGLFLNDEIKSRIYLDVVDEIRDQEGIIILPHPFRRNCDPCDLVKYVDLVEIINSRSRTSENIKSKDFFGKDAKRVISGSDAHTYFEIGKAVSEIDFFSDELDDIKKSLLCLDKICYGRSSPYYLSHGCSFIASRLKKWRS